MRYKPFPTLACLWIMIGMLCLLGCQSHRSLPSLAPVASLSKPTEDATKAAIESEKPLAAAEAATAKLPDSPTRTDLTTSLAKLRAWWAGNLAAWQNASASAKAIDAAVKDRDKQIVTLKKEVEGLQNSDPVKAWLYLVGIGALVIGCGVLIASFFVAALSAIPVVRSASIGAIVFGFLLVTIARFLTALYWIGAGVIVAGLIAGGVWLYTHRSILKAKAKKAAKVPALASLIGNSSFR